MRRRLKVGVAGEIGQVIVGDTPGEALLVAVYGSVARGEDEEHSNIDMYVVARCLVLQGTSL